MKVKKITFILMIFAGGVTAGAVMTGHFTGKVLLRMKNLSDKHLDLFMLLNQWIITKQNNKTIEKYLCDRGLVKIAIYGMSYVGERLYHELRGGKVTVLYGIDIKADGIYSDLKIYKPEEELDQVDAVIVTTSGHFEEIKRLIGQKMRTKILSLEDILYEM